MRAHTCPLAPAHSHTTQWLEAGGSIHSSMSGEQFGLTLQAPLRGRRGGGRSGEGPLQNETVGWECGRLGWGGGACTSLLSSLTTPGASLFLLHFQGLGDLWSAVALQRGSEVSVAPYTRYTCPLSHGPCPEVCSKGLAGR